MALYPFSELTLCSGLLDGDSQRTVRSTRKKVSAAKGKQSEWHIGLSRWNIEYVKGASSRRDKSTFPSFDHFEGATNQDVVLTEMCYYCHINQRNNTKTL